MAPLLEQAGDVAAWKPRSALLGVLLANRYRITQSIGQGSTGAVYRADDLLMNRPVAVRILVPSLAQNPAMVSRIRARIDRNVKIQQQQPDALVNLVDAFDVGMTLEGELFIVTDFLDGDHLSAMLERGGRLPWSRARHLFIRLSQLLQALHERGIVLGTLQAQHCYAVRNRPKNEAIKIVSTAVFEHIAANLGPGAGEVGVQMARYAAPEQGCGEPIDIRTDVYSFGIIAYELLTGKVPFNETNPIRLVAQHLHATPTPLRQAAPDAEIPAAVEEVVLKALAKSPADRHPSMEAFVAALSAIPADEAGTPVAVAAAPAEPPPAPTPPPPPPPAKPLASTLPVSSDNLSAPVPPVSSAAAAGAAVEEPPALPTTAPAKIAPSVVMRGLIDAPASPPAPPPPPSTSIAPPPPVGPRRPPSIAMPTLIPSQRRPSEPVAAAPASPAMSEGAADKPAEAPAPAAPAAAQPPPPPPVAAAPEPTPVAAAPAPAPEPPPAAPVAAAPVAAEPPAPVAAAPVAAAPVAAAPVAAEPPAPVAAAPVTPVAAPDTPAPVAAAPVTPAPVAAAPVTPAPVAAAPVTPAPVAAEPPSPPPPAPEPTAAVVAPVPPPPPFSSDRPAEAPRPAEIVRIPAPGDSARAAASESMRGPVPADSVRAPAPADSTRARAAEIVAVPAALSSQPAEEIHPAASVSARRVAAADVHPEALRAAALRQSQSGERLTSSAELRPTESIIAELPKRKTPWVAIVGLGAALAAGAAAYIQTEPQVAPQGNRAVTPPPAKVEPKATPTPAKVEPPPTPAKVEPPPPDPVPIVAPPPDPEPPPPDVESEEPKKKKKRKAKAAEPEEEEEDLFDQVRKHMEAKKAQEEAYRKAAEAGTSLPGPPTPAATNPTPAPTPKPPVEDNATKAKDTLDRARQAAQQGNHPLAYSLAKQANGLTRTQEAIELMGVSACKAGNADNARSAADQLTGARRSAVYSACAGNGITL
ncbi:serine/threonine-protein kinase [Nannocystis punicea]|uniref:Protein kinase n=1 Tax=Nannocystis punicea TaxID=2995304 RepID=A0ABY7H0J6_9BACT|nr:serine/threonine-protein kinase [Nannocystis poenicansa]WAS92753.1 protein kinase [Nannocystis poenicansa]